MPAADLSGARPPYLMFTRGLPASGKSTWAKAMLAEAPGTKLVCMDDLRSTIDGGEFSKENERIVQFAQDVIVTEAIEDGRDIIVHNTHMHAKTPNRLARLTADLCKPVVVDFTYTSSAVCIDRDAKREVGHVGEEVIRRMEKQLAGGTRAFQQRYDIVGAAVARDMLRAGKPTPVTFPPYVGDPALPAACIVDLDGTLADHQGRSPYAAELCEQDRFDETVWMAAAAFPHIIFCSGREDAYREHTTRWLAKHGVHIGDPNATYTNRGVTPGIELHMRKTGDTRADSIVKRELLAEFGHRYNVLVAFDDRDSVVATWRRLGITCYQVAPGRF